MNKILKLFFVIAIAVVLFIMWLSASETKDGELFAGILFLWISPFILHNSLKDKKPSLAGLRFRGILTGIMGIIVGLVLVVAYFM